MPPPHNFEVELPAGGKLQLQSVEETDLWDTTVQRYMAEYRLTKPNDLVLLGAILSQQLLLFRSQQAMSGMEAVLDASGVPTGAYAYNPPKASDLSRAQKSIQAAASEMRELEKTLGIDKKTREAGGAHTVANYIENLKLSAGQMGVHVSKRTKAFEQFCMDLRWKLRLLENGDEEDKNYHGISEEKLLRWCRDELGVLEEIDKKFANERGKLWVGKL